MIISEIKISLVLTKKSASPWFHCLSKLDFLRPDSVLRLGLWLRSSRSGVCWLLVTCCHDLGFGHNFHTSFPHWPLSILLLTAISKATMRSMSVFQTETIIFSDCFYMTLFQFACPLICAPFIRQFTLFASANSFPVCVLITCSPSPCRCCGRLSKNPLHCFIAPVKRLKCRRCFWLRASPWSWRADFWPFLLKRLFPDLLYLFIICINCYCGRPKC